MRRILFIAQDRLDMLKYTNPMRKDIRKEEQLLAQISDNPKYKGMQVVIIGDEIHILSTKSKITRAQLLTSLVKKYPERTPLITFVPKDSVLTL